MCVTSKYDWRCIHQARHFGTDDMTVYIMHSQQILELCLILSVALSIGYAIYLWTQKYWSGAIIFTIFAIISVICYFPMRKRIPLSKLILQFVFRIADKHKSVYFVALFTTVLQAAYSIYWAFTVSAGSGSRLLWIYSVCVIPVSIVTKVMLSSPSQHICLSMCPADCCNLPEVQP